MSLPVTIPFTFGNATTTQSLSSLDSNFTTIKNAVNGLTNGASQINVASITATGTANATTFLRGDGAWIAVSGSGTVTSIDVNGGTTGLTTSGGPVTTSGNITIAGTLVVANGGTGVSNLTLNNVILGNNTGTVKVVAPGTSGNVLTSNGTIWLSQAPTSSNGAKAWVRWGSTGTIASSYNVSSVTKNSTGNWTVNFTSSLTDANYAPIGMTAGAGTYGSYGVYMQQTSAPTTASCSVTTLTNNGVAVDCISNQLVIFGN